MQIYAQMANYPKTRGLVGKTDGPYLRTIIAKAAQIDESAIIDVLIMRINGERSVLVVYAS